MRTPPTQLRAAASPAPLLATCLLVLIVAVALVVPASFVLVELIRGVITVGPAARDVAPDVHLLARTLVTALIIAALATVLAWPAAWVARRWPWQRLLILLIPMLLPSYLAYSGWGMLRAPGTWLGNFLLRGPPGATSAAENWYPIAAARVQAVVGLTLWAWPLAAAVLIAFMRRIDENMLDALRLEPVGPLRRMLAVQNMLRRATLAAVGAVVLVMLGSSIPLHVAQFETYAIYVWRRMSEVPHAEQWRIWLSAWPLLTIAILAAILITRRITADDQDAAAVRQGERAGGWGRITLLWVMALVWSLSVVVPAILYITSLRTLQPLVRFWNLSWQPLLGSAGIAAGVTASAFVITICSWLMAAAGGVWRRFAIIIAGIFLAAGLAPGVLVGAAMARAWTTLGRWFPPARDLADTPAILAIAHIGRFGFIAALAGVVLARAEPRNLRDLRMIDTGPSFGGFIQAALPPQLGVVLAISLGVGLLSFHEIEAAILLQPPTAVGGNLPWQMLQFLHFARMDDLSASVLWVLGLALVGLALLMAAAHLLPRLWRGW